VLHDPAVPPEILDRSRADALRFPLPFEGREPDGLVILIKT